MASLLLALTIPDRSGGPRVTLGLTRALIARGNAVTLLHGHPPGHPEDATLLPEFRAAGARVRQAGFLRLPLGPLARAGLRRMVREAGTEVLVSCQVRDCALMLDVAATMGLPAVAIAQNTRRFVGSALLVALKTHVYRKAFRRSRPLLIAVSEAVRRQHVETFAAPAARAHVIPTGIDLTQFAPSGASRAALRDQLGLTRDGVLIVSVGRLQAQKGHDLALEALARLQAGRAPGATPWTYAVAGGVGESRAERDFAEALRARAAQPDLVDHVRFLGWLNPARTLMEAADLVLHPSRWEGGCPPLAVQEAMALGVPTLFSDCAGLPPGFVDERDGLTCTVDAPDAPRGIHRRLTELLDMTPAARQEIGAAGRRFAHDRCDQLAFATGVAALIEGEAARAAAGHPR